jgi:hypothetical protein
MNVEKLTALVKQGCSQRKMAELENCSQATIKYWLKKYSLKTTNYRNTSLFCKTCGETDPAKFYRRKNKTISRKQCSKCWSRRTIERNRKNKLQAIEYKGGKCQVCGYKKCPASLAFHHRNPEEKDLNWNTLRNMAFDKCKKELDKCDLVCHNCHSEIHWQLDNEWHYG